MAVLFKCSAKLAVIAFLLVVFERSCRWSTCKDTSSDMSGSAELSVGHILQSRPRYVAPKKVTKAAILKRSQDAVTGTHCLRIINLFRDVMLVSLLMQCNDVSSNPGPTFHGITCPSCLKPIRKAQANTMCSVCNSRYHLKCLGPEFETAKVCRLCFCPPTIEEPNDEGNFLSPDLRNLTGVRGMKFVHQNIQSLLRKIDELRLICSRLNNRIHVLTLSETWLDKDIQDSEIDIPGYQIFRLDRGARGGGVAAYVRNDLSVVRRSDLEMAGVEGMWLEVLPYENGVYFL